MNDMSWPLASLIGCAVCTLGTIAIIAMALRAGRAARKDDK